MLADTEIWRQVSEAIDEKRQTLIKAMVIGGCADYPKYRQCVGYLAALDEVEKAAQDIFGKMSGTDDNEENSVGEDYEL